MVAPDLENGKRMCRPFSQPAEHLQVACGGLLMSASNSAKQKSKIHSASLETELRRSAAAPDGFGQGLCLFWRRAALDCHRTTLRANLRLGPGDAPSGMMLGGIAQLRVKRHDPVIGLKRHISRRAGRCRSAAIPIIASGGRRTERSSAMRGREADAARSLRRPTSVSEGAPGCHPAQTL